MLAPCNIPRHYTVHICTLFHSVHFNSTPIYKGGSRNLPKNYRLVALTSHLIKILEKILAKNIHQFLETHQKTNPKQHGFRSGGSCLSQLLEHHNKILEELEKSSNVDVIHLDFAKAFDKVDHGILLNKLKKIGIMQP